MLPCSQRALIWVLEHVGNLGVRSVAAWLQPPWRQCTLFVCSNFKLLCHKMTSVSNMYAANLGYVASMLCCHYWDVQFE